MTPALPFWMKQRQVKTEQAGDEMLRLLTPNLPAYEIAVRPMPAGEWSGTLFRLPAGEGEKTLVAESEGFSQPAAAWQAAFELFRRAVVT